MEEWVLPKIDLAVCSLCGACVEACPSGAVVMGGQGPLFTDPIACTYCAVCEDACPEGAIVCEYVIVWEPGPLPDSRDSQGGPS
jgi:formate hydrogenlyase subunit 6/NADH:ubiquinone oxidoreductase subunit I